MFQGGKRREKKDYGEQNKRLRILCGRSHFHIHVPWQVFWKIFESAPLLKDFGHGDVTVAALITCLL